MRGKEGFIIVKEFTRRRGSVELPPYHRRRLSAVRDKTSGAKFDSGVERRGAATNANVGERERESADRAINKAAE